jgi:hypothetical protein
VSRCACACECATISAGEGARAGEAPHPAGHYILACAAEGKRQGGRLRLWKQQLGLLLSLLRAKLLALRWRLAGSCAGTNCTLCGCRLLRAGTVGGEVVGGEHQLEAAAAARMGFGTEERVWWDAAGGRAGASLPSQTAGGGEGSESPPHVSSSVVVLTGARRGATRREARLGVTVLRQRRGGVRGALTPREGVSKQTDRGVVGTC